MNPLLESKLHLTRRQFLGRTTTGIGVIGFGNANGRA